MSSSSGSATTTGSLRIVYRDEEVLVAEKPAGIHTLGAPPALASLLAEKYPELKFVGGADWGAVHRLDRETSGLVVFARNQKGYDFLRGEFSKNRVAKEYTAIVE